MTDRNQARIDKLRALGYLTIEEVAGWNSDKFPHVPCDTLTEIAVVEVNRKQTPLPNGYRWWNFGPAEKRSLFPREVVERDAWKAWHEEQSRLSDQQAFVTPKEISDMQRLSYFLAGAFVGSGGFDGKEDGLNAAIADAIMLLCARAGMKPPAKATAERYAKFALGHWDDNLRRETEKLSRSKKDALIDGD